MVLEKHFDIRNLAVVVSEKQTNKQKQQQRKLVEIVPVEPRVD